MNAAILMAETEMPGRSTSLFYYNAVWKQMHYRGVRILNFPSDLLNYQEIFVEHPVQWSSRPYVTRGSALSSRPAGTQRRNGSP